MLLCIKDPRQLAFAELNIMMLLLLIIAFHRVAQNAACLYLRVEVFSLYCSCASYLKWKMTA